MTRSAWMMAAVLTALVVLAGLVVWRAEGDAPRVAGPDELYLGKEPRTLTFELADAGSGLRSVRVVLNHARGDSVVLERSFAGGALLGGGPAAEGVEATLDPQALGLAEGSGFLRVEVRDWSWRGPLAGNAAELEIPVEIDLRAPRVAVSSGLTYVRRGGAAAVAYRLSERAQRDGVVVGERFYPGVSWPLEGAGCADLGGGESACRLALFAVPVDAAEDTRIRVRAEDRAGNAAAAGWATRIQPREIPEVPIDLTQRFLEGKVLELAEAWGLDASDPVAAFREINTRVRERDEARIRELATGASPEAAWHGVFQQLANSKVTSLFAERRRYRVDGELVSEATHYGYDLASTAGAPVTASNAGRVLFAGELGIYGNCLLVEHGLGVVSLYGHLSSLEVAEGERVAQGQTLGRSGQTGLAGGDHLHFAMLVGGTYVDPREWWDPRWVREHIEARIGR